MTEMGEEQGGKNPKKVILEREHVQPPEKLVIPIPEPPKPAKKGKD